MTLKEYADLATALTLIVATITFVLAFIEHRQREREKMAVERQKLIQNWQTVVVYKIIEEGANDFSRIKSLYLDEAMQFLSFDLPKREIQDDALHLALLSLMRDRLISKRDTGGYAINVVSLDENAFKQMALAEMQHRKDAMTLIAKVYDLLETDSGKYTIDRLYTLLKASDMNFTFEEFNMLIRNHMSVTRSIVTSAPSERLWLRDKHPNAQAPSVTSKASPSPSQSQT